MTLSYYPANTNLIKCIAPFFRSRGFEIIPFNEDNKQVIDVFVLFCPVPYLNSFISCERLWKRYFDRHRPKTIFLTAGFLPRDKEFRQYIDLLSMEDLDEVMEEARPGKSWIPIDSGGLDLFALINRFLDGHGEESVLAVFSDLLRILQMVHDDVNHSGTTYEEALEALQVRERVVKKWALLKYRWAYYAPYFGCLPFHSIVANIDSIIHLLNPFFANHCESAKQFKELAVLPNLKELKQSLQEVREYVH